MANKCEAKRAKSNKWLRQAKESFHNISTANIMRLWDVEKASENITEEDYICFCMFDDKYQLRCNHEGCEDAEFCSTNPLELGYLAYIEEHPESDVTRGKYLNMKLAELV
jgi:hypothetical protein